MYKYLCDPILVMKKTTHSNYTVFATLVHNQNHRSDTDNREDTAIGESVDEVGSAVSGRY